jgi:hypothetical protein
MNRTLPWRAALCAICLSASAVVAEPSGFYLGLNVGRSESDVDKGSLDAAVAASVAATPSAWSSESDSKLSSTISFGYRFNRYFAAEASYVGLAREDYRAGGLRAPTSNSSPVLRFDAAQRWQTEGFTLCGIASVPLGSRFDMHARAGVYFADTELERFIVTYTRASQRSSELTAGVGVGYSFDSSFGLSIDYSRYPNVGTAATQEFNVDNISASMAYRF